MTEENQYLFQNNVKLYNYFVTAIIKYPELQRKTVN